LPKNDKIFLNLFYASLAAAVEKTVPGSFPQYGERIAGDKDTSRKGCKCSQLRLNGESILAPVASGTGSIAISFCYIEAALLAARSPEFDRKRRSTTLFLFMMPNWITLIPYA